MVTLLFFATALGAQCSAGIGSKQDESEVQPTATAQLARTDEKAALDAPAVGISSRSQGDHLVFAGSTSMHPVVADLTQMYLEKNQSLTAEINGGGSTQGVYAVVEGAADIGIVSRDYGPTVREQFPSLYQFPLGYDVIAIATNVDVDLPGLSATQTRDIFAGEISNLGQVGGPDRDIIVVTREVGSDRRSSFETLVMSYDDGGQEKQKSISSGPRTVQAKSDDEMRKLLALNAGEDGEAMIGYLPPSKLDELVRPVSIDGVEPSAAAVADASYPFFLPLYLITNNSPEGLADQFLDFVFSDEGQAVVARHCMPALSIRFERGQGEPDLLPPDGNPGPEPPVAQ